MESPIAVDSFNVIDKICDAHALAVLCNALLSFFLYG